MKIQKIRTFYSQVNPNVSRLSLKPEKRIGPHNIDSLSILFGSLLGDTHGQLRKIQENESVRFLFEQSSKNVEYLT